MQEQEGAPARLGAGVVVLLGLRFLLELALWGSFLVVGVVVVGGLLGWVVGLVACAAVVVVWGMLLSPRRRIRSPLAARLAVEAGLFLLAAVGLVAAGWTTAALALVIAEVVVLGLLGGPDRHAV